MCVFVCLDGIVGVGYNTNVNGNDPVRSEWRTTFHRTHVKCRPAGEFFDSRLKLSSKNVITNVNVKARKKKNKDENEAA